MPESFPQEMSEKLHTKILSTFLCLKPSCRGSWELQSRVNSHVPAATLQSVKKGRRGFPGRVASSTQTLWAPFPSATASELFYLMTECPPQCWNQAFHEMSTSCNPGMNLNTPCPDLTTVWPRATFQDCVPSRTSFPYLCPLSREGNS